MTAEFQDEAENTIIPTDETFEGELKNLINKYSVENRSNTPDFILASFMLDCLAAWGAATINRERWFGRVEHPDPWGDT